MHPGGSANKVARTHAAPPGSRARPAPTLEPAAGAGSFKTDRCVAQTPPPRQKSHPPPPHRHTRHSFTPTPPRRRRNRARPQFTELLAVFERPANTTSTPPRRGVLISASRLEAQRHRRVGAEMRPSTSAGVPLMRRFPRRGHASWLCPELCRTPCGIRLHPAANHVWSEGGFRSKWLTEKRGRNEN